MSCCLFVVVGSGIDVVTYIAFVVFTTDDVGCRCGRHRHYCLNRYTVMRKKRI